MQIIDWSTLYKLQGGFNKREMVILASGRQTGKSKYYWHIPSTPAGDHELKFSMLPKSKYKFSRQWHVATVREKDYDDVRAWCIETFGPEDKHPDAWSRWIHRYADQIHIRDAKDYHWYVLRWGS